MVQFECPRHSNPSVSFCFEVCKMALFHYWLSGVIRNGPQDESELEDNGPIDERATVVEVSVANLNFISEISNLNYPGIYVHVASNSHLGGL